jgi:hypothetical protein
MRSVELCHGGHNGQSSSSSVTNVVWSSENNIGVVPAADVADVHRRVEAGGACGRTVLRFA